MSRFDNDETNDIFLELDAAVKSHEQLEYFICLITQVDEKISKRFL